MRSAMAGAFGRRDIPVRPHPKLGYRHVRFGPNVDSCTAINAVRGRNDLLDQSVSRSTA
jgi:hypothetical protein